MKTADLLALADREADTLTAQQCDASAAIVRALTERLRELKEKLRNAGVQMPEDK